MKALALPNLVMGSICFTVAFYEFLTWLRMRGRIRDLAFAATSLGGAVFNMACAGEYNVSVTLQSIIWLRIQAVALNLTGLAFLWYFSVLTARVRRAAVAVFATLLGLASLTQLLGLGDLTWVANQPFIKHVALPFGIRIDYLEVESGPLTDASSYVGILLLGYLVWVTLRFRRSGAGRESTPLFWMLGIVGAAYLSDFAVNEGIYSFVFTVEYAWLAVVVIVGQQRSKEMLDAAVAKRKLQASEGRLLASLEEKDLLLKEIHHRVKNNLQLVSSILFLQARRVVEPSFRSLLQDCRNQVASMALIHEDLYRSKDFRHVDFGAYVRTLLGRLIGSYRGEGIPFSSVEADEIMLGIDRAIPCGLIVNELCTNALKHAFPPGLNFDTPQVRVTLRRIDGERFKVEVSDNGIGLPIGFDPSVATSFGMKIVAKLSDQLGAELRIDVPPELPPGAPGGVSVGGDASGVPGAVPRHEGTGARFTLLVPSPAEPLLHRGESRDIVGAE